MEHARLIEKPEAGPVRPNLPDYAEAVASFSWEAARRELDGLPGGRGLNIAYEAVDRHAASGRGDRTAIRFLDEGGGASDVTYGELRERTSRFANVLRDLGVGPGERVATLLERVPEQYVVAFGALKNRSVFCPLLPTLGPDLLRACLEASGARVLVTTEELHHRVVRRLRPLPGPCRVILTGGPGTGATRDLASLASLLARAAPRFEIPPTDPADEAILHFGGGAGLQGTIHAHAAVIAHHATGRLALDLHPDDVYWCPAAPGWVVGTSYGIVAPLVCGVTSVVDALELEPRRCCRVLQEQQVTVWYTTPTAIRMLMKEGAELPWSHDLSRLRFVASAGEPLSAEEMQWSLEALGRPVHDQWWQTETGAIMLANFASMPIKPGSMGRPVPGVRAAVVGRSPGGPLEILEGSGDVAGELALEAGWPSMFRGYLGNEARYRSRFAEGWYLSGDLVRRDADGYYWFLGRSDDAIKSAGQLIGPFEGERVLLAHPAVAEAAVVGKPDPVAHEIVKAFVVLRPGHEPSEDQRRGLLGWTRARLGEAVAPREIEFVSSLPRSPEGLILRRLLREGRAPEG